MVKVSNLGQGFITIMLKFLTLQGFRPLTSKLREAVTFEITIIEYGVHTM
jgi:hypothetical protein